jgi:hypothetical protein
MKEKKKRRRRRGEVEIFIARAWGLGPEAPRTLLTSVVQHLQPKQTG